MDAFQVQNLERYLDSLGEFELRQVNMYAVEAFMHVYEPQHNSWREMRLVARKAGLGISQDATGFALLKEMADMLSHYRRG
ncbi:hypothetical protein MWN34_10645 [Ancylobacter sp. 6x-1]|uniref:Uncharacterized protein n=1 Tax=Ancylobacter crimeensis TaxID=2579147 RepID=A0ABT0DBM8_9HYPH|nr:hypothetical protein [Ancylobacter crimeensis]MCK0197370.1 hypothetical protein [Ancylobacter crimeensis]